MDLLTFKIKKQWLRLIPIILSLISIIFIAFQLSGIFHFPLKNNSDFDFLNSNGEREYLFEKRSETELNEATINYFNNRIKAGDVKEKKVKKAIDSISEIGVYKTLEKYKDDKYIYSWMMAGIKQSELAPLSVEKVNAKIIKETNGYGYQKDFQNKYITYTQAIFGFLIIAYAFFFIKSDEYNNSLDIYHVSVGSKLKYYIIQIMTLILPIIVIQYILGLVMNVYTYHRFIRNGYDILYLPFTYKFVLYFVPTVLCFCAVSVFIINVFKRSTVLIPLYLIWIVFNITPQALNDNSFFKTVVVLKRLDFGNYVHDNIIFEQFMVVLFSIFVFILAYKVRFGKRHYFKKILSTNRIIDFKTILLLVTFYIVFSFGFYMPSILDFTNNMTMYFPILAMIVLIDEVLSGSDWKMDEIKYIQSKNRIMLFLSDLFKKFVLLSVFIILIAKVYTMSMDINFNKAITLMVYTSSVILSTLFIGSIVILTSLLFKNKAVSYSVGLMYWIYWNVSVYNLTPFNPFMFIADPNEWVGFVGVQLLIIFLFLLASVFLKSKSPYFISDKILKLKNLFYKTKK